MTKPLLSIAAFAARWLPASVQKVIYRSGPLAKFIRARLNKAHPSGIMEFTVAGGALAGRRLMLDYRTEKYLWLGTYELELTSALQELVAAGMIVYDVGANLGYMSLILADIVGESGRVFAFEALPSNVKRFQANLDINPQVSNIEIVPKAVADSSGTVEFKVHESHAAGKVDGSAGREESYLERLEVPAISLDDFVFSQGQPPPQIVKMDIEGGEVLALPGMQRILEQHQPLLFLELHGPEAKLIAWEILTSIGYTFHEISSPYPAVASLETDEWVSYLLARHPK
ncbi:MAG: FkbM family methyltransferase [Chloroflexi bacterium]|nr:FkbM family methyltransferase [Chloroflexota bacterium]